MPARSSASATVPKAIFTGYSWPSAWMFTVKARSMFRVARLPLNAV